MFAYKKEAICARRIKQHNIIRTSVVRITQCESFVYRVIMKKSSNLHQRFLISLFVVFPDWGFHIKFAFFYSIPYTNVCVLFSYRVSCQCSKNSRLGPLNSRLGVRQVPNSLNLVGHLRPPQAKPYLYCIDLIKVLKLYNT